MQLPSPANTSSAEEMPEHQEGRIKSESDSVNMKPKKPRHRASIACSSCRDRRIRCVVPPGEKDCAQCKRTGAECVIRDDDERRRPISRAYMRSLADRIALLENLLTENGIEPPPANHPAKTRRVSRGDEEPSQDLYIIKQEPDNDQGSSILRSGSSPFYDSIDAYHAQQAEETNASMPEAPAGDLAPPFKLDGSKDSVVPARRCSTDMATEKPPYKRRQASRPGGCTTGSEQRPARISTIAETDLDVHIQSSPPCFETESDSSDCYAITTPRSEHSTWYKLDCSTTHMDPYALSLMSNSNCNPAPSLSMPMAAPSASAWMDAHFENTDALPQLANMPFPVMTAASEGIAPLDYLKLETAQEWKGWHDRLDMGVGVDLDGFPPRTEFGSSFEGAEGGYTGTVRS